MAEPATEAPIEVSIWGDAYEGFAVYVAGVQVLHDGVYWACPDGLIRHRFVSLRSAKRAARRRVRQVRRGRSTHVDEMRYSL